MKSNIKKSKLSHIDGRKAHEYDYGCAQKISARDALGINFEEMALYDILKIFSAKYSFTYSEEIKALLKVGLTLLLDRLDYLLVESDDVYNEIFEQTENF